MQYALAFVKLMVVGVVSGTRTAMQYKFALQIVRNIVIRVLVEEHVNIIAFMGNEALTLYVDVTIKSPTS